MEFESTSVFHKDVGKLDKNERKMLKELLEQIALQPESGKPMEHHAGVFSKRTTSRRLIWQFNGQDGRDGKILLLLYKNRDEAYQALRQMKF
jgi:mRNA-degrading endonuclease RelE of RelBE toxin-antitoxin system